MSVRECTVCRVLCAAPSSLNDETRAHSPLGRVGCTSHGRTKEKPELEKSQVCDPAKDVEYLL